MQAAKSQFMAGEVEPDAGDPGEGMEQDPLDALSPQAQAVFQTFLDEGVMPTMNDLVAQGVDPSEAQAVLAALDLAFEGAGEPPDESVDVGQGVPPKF